MILGWLPRIVARATRVFSRPRTELHLMPWRPNDHQEKVEAWGEDVGAWQAAGDARRALARSCEEATTAMHLFEKASAVPLEDDVADTQLPRAIAAGADAARLVQIRDIGVEKRPVSLPGDISRMRDVIAATGAKLLIIDPITSTWAKPSTHPGTWTCGERCHRSRSSLPTPDAPS